MFPISHTLVVDFIDAEVVFENVVFRKIQGMLSGHPGTLPENTDIHYGLIFTMFTRILKSQGLDNLATVSAFEAHVGLIIASDDILMSFTNKISKYITPEDIFNGYKQLNIGVTAADKSETLGYQDIWCVYFLKMGFHMVGNRIGMNPKTSIIYQLLNWQRITEGKETQLNTQILTAMRFAYWKGIEFYNNILSILDRKLIEVRRPPFGITHEEMGAIIHRCVLQGAFMESNPLASLKDRLSYQQNQEHMLNIINQTA